MALRLFNTLRRKKEVFEPLEPPKVRMYTCGPTVYNYAHIGNYRTFVFEDLLRRFLKYRGYDVFQVMNLTDVEDKIIRACRETGESRASLTKRYTDAFFEDIERLGIERAECYPAATDHVEDMVALIKKLLDKGHAYEADGSIYFRLKSFPTYGRLSHFDVNQLVAGASGRVDTDEYSREDARDFVLWKAHDAEDGDIFWETGLGKGRPGWHIECSAMSMKYLGESFDIHCGGVDNIFPHHENEIAQSEAATGKPFVKYWLHSAHLLVNNRKMAKSLGNFYTLRDLLEQGHDPLAIRWVLLATHYRQPNNFTFEALEAAKQSLARIRDFSLRLGEIRRKGGSDLAPERAACEKAFGEALDDDLNISAALATAFEFIRQTNKVIDDNAVSIHGARNALDLLGRLNAVTGLFPRMIVAEGDLVLPALQVSGVAGVVPADVLELVKKRSEARRSKDYGRADAIRDELATKGWIVEDTPDGPRLKRR